MTNRLGLPNLGFGLGLRSIHFDYIIKNKPKIGWFEIISENYLDQDGRPKRVLDEIKEHYPIVMHGVSMSIGSTDPLDKVYLKKLKNLIEWVKPAWVSDHLCWTGINKFNSHDLLPVPYSKQALQHIVDRIQRVQEYLGRPLILENPSTYLEFKQSSMPEWEFLSQMVEAANCGILLDINNVYVSAYNHKYDPKIYISSIPHHKIAQIHLAGHTNNGNHIIDTHNTEVIDEVWELYKMTIKKTGMVSTMVEWDDNIPEFAQLEQEVLKAKKYINQDLSSRRPELCDKHYPKEGKSDLVTYRKLLQPLQDVIISGSSNKSAHSQWIKFQPNFPPNEQIGVYVNGYRYRLYDAVAEDYIATKKLLGEERFDHYIYSYIRNYPSSNFNLNLYSQKFASFLKDSRIPAAIKEVADLESELLSVFSMKESKPLSTTDLKTISLDNFEKYKFKLRTAHKLCYYKYAVNDYLNFIYSEGLYQNNYQEVNSSTAQYKDVVPSKRNKSIKSTAIGNINKAANHLLIFRHDDLIFRMTLAKLEYELLKLIAKGNSVGNSLNKLIDRNKIIDYRALTQQVQTWFSKWNSAKIFSQN